MTGKKSEKASFKTINNRDYLFDENGHMMSGWIYSDGSPVAEDNEDGWKDALYYLGEATDGAAAKGWRKYVSMVRLKKMALPMSGSTLTATGKRQPRSERP